ncbi:MAG: tetratricopeptide repeat protein [Alphaproteobacteria bacterium]|nr:tetratricopeptide repeat protein [Alphaproteobacteria bacterium]
MLFMLALASAQDAQPESEPSDTPVAPADDAARTRAKELFDNATRLYEEGDYSASLIALEEANKVFPSAAFQFNIANCLERLGRYEEAIAAMNRYRAVAPASETEVLERRIRSMETRLEEERKAAEDAAKQAEANKVQTRTVKRPTWSLVGAGAGLVVVGGVGAIVSKSSADKAFDVLDRSRYDGMGTLNIASLAASGVGVGLVGVGLALTNEKLVVVGVTPGAGPHIAFGGAL